MTGLSEHQVIALNIVIFYVTPAAVVFAFGFWAGVERERKRQKDRRW